MLRWNIEAIDGVRLAANKMGQFPWGGGGWVVMLVPRTWQWSRRHARKARRLKISVRRANGISSLMGVK